MARYQLAIFVGRQVGRQAGRQTGWQVDRWLFSKEDCRTCMLLRLLVNHSGHSNLEGLQACMQDCKAARLYESNWGVSWYWKVVGLSAELLGKMCSLAKDNLFFSYENRSTSIHMNHRGLPIGVGQ